MRHPNRRTHRIVFATWIMIVCSGAFFSTPAQVWGQNGIVFPFRSTTVAPANGYYDPSGQILNPQTAAISQAQNQNYEWTVASYSTAGWLIRTTPIELPQGKYIAWIQVWHKNWTGKLGEVRLRNGNAIHAKTDINGQKFGNWSAPQGEYQRVPLTFTLKETAKDVSLEVYYNNQHYIWTGATHITRLGDWNGVEQRRPIFAIAHRRNNIARLNSAFDTENANAVEIDIAPISADGEIIQGFRAHHPAQGVPADDSMGWGTASRDMPRFWRRIRHYLDSQKAVCVVLDLKLVTHRPVIETEGDDYRGTHTHYANQILDVLQENGFERRHLARLIFSVPAAKLA